MAFKKTLPIIIAPDPILREVCEPCEVGDPSLKKLAKQMANTMYANNGCGIAAPQVGVAKRLVVIDCDQEDGKQDPVYLVNPVVEETRGKEVVEEEGCLSVPGISVPIRRKEYAVVRYFDLDGEEWIIEGDGLLGRCLQHELDHLDGKTLFESCDLNTRMKALADYDVALKKGAKPGDTSVEE